MIFCKILIHDLRCGILRLRFLIVPFIAIIPLGEFHWLTSVYNISGTSMDMLFYIFRGANPVSVLPGTNERVELPLLWLLVIGSCLLLNMDYFLNDLALSGQQVIIRCKKRSEWYISKCIWNMFSTLSFFLLLITGVVVFTFLSDSQLSLSVSLDTIAVLFGVQGLDTFSFGQAIIIGITLPCVTIMALNLLEMTLCLYVKPILSFLFCVGLLVLSVYCDDSFILGNGAMTIRNIVNRTESASVQMVFISTALIIIGCIILGMIRFIHMDILPKED